MATRLICASHSPLLYCYKRQPKRWDELQDAFRDQAAAIKAFDPELVIAFGSDHFNGFFLDNMPSFCVGFKAEAVGDIGGFPGELAVDGDTAQDLARHLKTNGVDVSFSRAMTVDHAFSQTIHIMLGGLTARPVIPVFINCINPPFVPFERSRILGEQVASFVAQLDRRVLFLASGGMSHHPTRYYPAPGEGEPPVAAWQLSGGSLPGSLTKKQWLQRLYDMHHEGAEMIARGERTAADMHLNEEADSRFLALLQENRLEEYGNWDQGDLVREAGIGFMELHTWLAAASAHRACGGGRPVVEFYDVMMEIGIAAGVVSAS